MAKKVTLTLERSKYPRGDGRYDYTVEKAINTLEWYVWQCLTHDEVYTIIETRDDVTVNIIPPKN